MQLDGPTSVEAHRSHTCVTQPAHRSMRHSLTETRFQRLDDRSNPEYAHLEKDRVGTFTLGEISLLVPEVDEIHQMDNHTDKPTVEIHVYGNDLVGMDRCQFDLETGKVKHYVSKKYDNE